MSPEERTPDREKERELRGGWRRWMGIGLVVLGLALVAGFASYSISLLTLIEEQGRVIAQLKQEAGQAAQLSALLSADDSEIIRLSGPSGKDGWKGTILRDPRTHRAFLHISAIATADTGMQYIVWLVGKGDPVRVTGFRVPANGAVSQFVERLPLPGGSGATVVVTTDPDGRGNFGSGTLVLAGSIPQ